MLSDAQAQWYLASLLVGWHALHMPGLSHSACW